MSGIIKELPTISLNNIYKSYGSGEGKVDALKNINLEIEKGEFLALCGPSGSGKSTLLNILSGIDKPTVGSVMFLKKLLNHLPEDQLSAIRGKHLGFIFQFFNLIPVLSVFDNVFFPLVLNGHVGKKEAKERALHFIDSVGLAGFTDRKPGQLSGGQQQRVALARSLVKRPKLLLLDEPMSALDKQIRQKTQIELVKILEQVGVTCIMVTHDQEEAMTMATRIAVMDAGWIQQVGKPDEIYEQPANRFVAGFIGSVNLFEGVIDEDLPEYVTVRTPLFPAPIYVAHGITCYEGQEVAFALRPEKVMIGKDEPEGATNKAQGVIEDIAYFGSHSVYHVRLPSGAKVLSNFANSQRWASDGLTWGDAVWVHWRDNDGVVLTA